MGLVCGVSLWFKLVVIDRRLDSSFCLVVSARRFGSAISLGVVGGFPLDVFCLGGFPRLHVGVSGRNRRISLAEIDV